MCLILFGFHRHPRYPLIVAANRDEFHDRPTTSMHWWPDREILAGRDERSGGTWMAITPRGEVAAVTNVREPGQTSGTRSRGELPLAALRQTNTELTAYCDDQAEQYEGYNLVKLSGREGWYYSNRDPQPGRRVFRGSYGVSNHLLQSPWPKLVRQRQRLDQMLAHRADRLTTGQLHDALIDQLRDSEPAPDHLLPDTGVGIQFERFLSPPFIVGPTYGTRATTVVTVDDQGHCCVTEQAWQPGGEPATRNSFNWQTTLSL